MVEPVGVCVAAISGVCRGGWGKRGGPRWASSGEVFAGDSLGVGLQRAREELCFAAAE